MELGAERGQSLFAAIILSFGVGNMARKRGVSEAGPLSRS